ncbi:transglutaminase [Cupriavidus sp. USMAA2-4]|uniref:Transglutaminase n=1 Tax=Cupriavidus malaysiensis TaxID=367825 RepID=A0ABM6F493_9BURK|nr:MULTISPECIES: transglutaminase family protein [Cupriavidus]AOY90802.1 transglutaminase [Cupriavidus sp. USMAA2-4]AOY99597.1 transglutaminase [Cupriavidus sp. USMAHM13]AOZ06245.1 transglutaminase [Cupriavidus malaysiensis]
MRLAIRHISRFQLDDHAAYALQRLHLRPQSGPGQTVRAWQVTIDGIEPMLTYADGLGNQTDLVRHEGDKPEVVIVAAGVVETHDCAGVLGQGDSYAPPWLFERETELTRAGDAVAALAAEVPGETPGLEVLHWLMTAIHGRVAYTPERAAEAPADAEAALASGEGSSRDYAHVFIAAARALKIPARFISGYLMTDSPARRLAESLRLPAGALEAAAEAGRRQPAEQDGEVAVEDEDEAETGGTPPATRDAAGEAPARQRPAAAVAQPPSAHAWAEAFVEGLGWVGFDPFLNRCPDERYVRIAAGLDYRDAMPVMGPGARAVGVEISVIPAPELV